ncbi:hypothetical protein BH23BAC1_BH23BAC1_33310 [soil metagenome]
MPLKALIFLLLRKNNRENTTKGKMRVGILERMEIENQLNPSPFNHSFIKSFFR